MPVLAGRQRHSSMLNTSLVVSILTASLIQPHQRMRVNNTSTEAAMTLWDFVLATLPIVFLWDIRISQKTKAGICALMGLGVL